MKISPIGYSLNNLSFASKKSDIRKADDVQRKAKLAYPILSPTYIKEFYVSSQNEESNYHDKNYRTMPKLWRRVKTERVLRENEVSNQMFKKRFDDNAKDFLVAYLDWFKNHGPYGKVGNCGENTKIILAGLFANGYYNSSIMKLGYRVAMVDKNTKEEIVSQEMPIDHMVVATDMNSRDDKDIIIDSWLGFADDKSKAIEKYKGIFLNEETKQLENDCKEACKRNLANRLINYKPENYYMTKGFIFKPVTTHKNDDLKRIAGYQLKKEYPELIV